MPLDPRVSCGTATIIYDPKTEKILIGKRIGEHLNGYYCVPGGWVDFEDENLETAAKREVKEETNLDVEIKKFYRITYEKHEMFSCTTIYFIAIATDSTQLRLMEPTKHESWQWININDAMYLKPLFPNLLNILIGAMFELDSLLLSLEEHEANN